MACTIAGTLFSDLSPAYARCEMDFVPGNIQEKKDHFHLVGVSGSYSSRGGYMTQALAAVLRYRDSSRENVMGAFAEDLYSWTDVDPFTIEGPDEVSYARCEYTSHHIRNRGPCGDGDFFLIVEFQFLSLGLAL